MPLAYSPGQKKYILQNEGYDPDKFDFDDNGNVFEKPKLTSVSRVTQSPAVPTIPQAPEKLDTFRRSATESIIPTIAGIAGTGAAAYLTGGASLVPQIIAGIAGGVGGSMLGAKAQEAVVPEQIKKDYFTRPEDLQNPWSKGAGAIIPQIVQMNPVAGVQNLASIAGKVPNMIRNPMYAAKTLTDRDTQALVNAVGGAGIGGGIDAAMQLAGEQEFSIPQLLTTAAGGAVMNAPYNNRFNKAMGVHPLPESNPIVPPQIPIPQTWNPNVSRVPIHAPREGNFPDIQQPGIGATTIPEVEALAKAKIIQDGIDAKKAQAAEDLRIANLGRREPTPIEPPVTPEYNLDVLPVDRKKEFGIGTEADPTMSQVFQQMTATKKPNEGMAPDTSPEVKQLGLMQERIDVLEKRLEKLIPESNKSSEWKGPDPTVVRSIRAHADGEMPNPYNRYSSTPEATQRTGEPISPEALDIAKRRGVNISDEESLPSNIKGVENYDKRQVRLNPFNSDTSTLGHESLGHTFVTDLFNSTDPKDVKLVSDAREVAKRAGITDEKGIQEFVANSVGEDFQRRMKLRLSGSFKEKFNSWTKDIKDYLAYRKGANDEAASSMIAKRGLTDAPFGTRKEIVTDAALSLGTRGAIKSPVRSTGSNPEESGRTREGEGSEGFSKDSGEGERTGEGSGNSKDTLDSSNRNSPEGGEANKEVTNSDTTKDTPISSSLPRTKSLEEAADYGGNRYSTGERAKKSVEGLPKGKEEKISLPGLRSQVDAIRAHEKLGPNRVKVADAFEANAEQYRKNSGEYKDKFLYDLMPKLDLGFNLTNLKQWASGDSIRSKRILQYLDDMQETGGSKVSLDAKDKEIVADIRKMLDKVREDQNTRPGLEAKGKDPNYFPQNIKQDKLNILLNEPDSAEGKLLAKKYVDYVSEKMRAKDSKLSVEESRAQAEQFLTNIKKSTASGDINIAKQFGPIDKAVGYGLPPELRETNLSARLSHYLDRTARRFAHYDTIESRPEVQEALFGKEALIGAESVQHAYKKIAGIRSANEALVEGATGILKSAVTGTVAGLRDVITTPILGAQHQTFFQVPRIAIQALAHLKENWRESFGQGLNKKHIGALESLDASGGFPAALNLMRRVRDISNEVQLRTWLEQLSRTWAYSQGKLLATENLIAYKKGKASSQQKRFLKDFGGEALKSDMEVSENTLKDIATRYAESVAGTYDIRGLPNWSMEGPIAPVFTLGRWNIEKANNFIKYTIDPLKEGDFRPLLNQTAWLLLAGGTTMEAFNELVTKKKSKLPTMKEIQTSKDMGGDFWKPLGYRAAGLAAITGFAGELANIAKIAADSHYKNPNKWYNIMLVEFADKARKYIPELAGSVARQDPSQTLEILNDFGQEYVQTWRVLMRQVSKEKQDELLRQDENRDVRVFKQLMDKDLSELPGDNVKDYSKEPIRDFKNARTPKEVSETFKPAIKRAIEGKTKDPEELKASLSGLKNISYHGFPSMDNSPIEAASFTKFLNKTQGPKITKERIQEALYMNELNKTKRGLIPKM